MCYLPCSWSLAWLAPPAGANRSLWAEWIQRLFSHFNNCPDNRHCWALVNCNGTCSGSFVCACQTRRNTDVSRVCSHSEVNTRPQAWMDRAGHSWQQLKRKYPQSQTAFRAFVQLLDSGFHLLDAPDLQGFESTHCTKHIVACKTKKMSLSVECHWSSDCFSGARSICINKMLLEWVWRLLPRGTSAEPSAMGVTGWKKVCVVFV